MVNEFAVRSVVLAPTDAPLVLVQRVDGRVSGCDFGRHETSAADTPVGAKGKLGIGIVRGAAVVRVGFTALPTGAGAERVGGGTVAVSVFTVSSIGTFPGGHIALLYLELASRSRPAVGAHTALQHASSLIQQLVCVLVPFHVLAKAVFAVHLTGAHRLHQTGNGAGISGRRHSLRDGYHEKNE